MFLPIRAKLLFCFLFLAFAASATGPQTNCPSKLTDYQPDEEGPFAGDWYKEDTFLEQFRAFDRILVLADGKELTESFRVACHYPHKQVVGNDLWVSPWYTPPPNLVTVEADLCKPFPFDENAFDLVYLKAGLCHCKTRNRSCCGIRKTPSDIRFFLQQVIRAMNKGAPHAMAVLDGMMPEDIFLEWEPICQDVAQANGFRCVPQIFFNTGHKSIFWGFKIRR